MDRPMDLRFTPAQEAFRHEARAWLAAHAPPPRSLPSLDTAEGFEAHRALGADHVRRPVVGGVVARGVRRPGVGILEWLVFEEEYWRAAGPPPGQPERGVPAGPDHVRVRDRRSRRSGSCPPWPRGGRSGARAGPSPTPAATWPASAAGPCGRAPRRRMAAVRPEDLGLPGRVRRMVLRAVPHRPGGRAPSGPHLLPHRHGHARGDRPPHPPDRRGDRVRRDLLRGRVRPRRPGARRGGAGMERGHGHRRLRAGAQPAQPGPLHRGRRPPGGACTASGWPPTPTGRPAAPTPWPRPGWTPRPTGSTPCGPPPGCSTADRSGPRPAPTRSTGRRPTWPSTGRPWPCSGPRPSFHGDPGTDDAVARRLPLRPGRPHLRRHQRDPAQRGGRAHARAAPGLSRERTAMHFAFTDQQLEFRDAVRQVLAKECTTDDLRAAYDAPSARTPRWTTLADMGVVGPSVPEDHGGLGLGLVDLVLLLEEAGRVALPEPLLETTALAAPLLAELGAGSAVADAGPALTGWPAWLEAHRWRGRAPPRPWPTRAGDGAGGRRRRRRPVRPGDGAAPMATRRSMPSAAERVTVTPVPSLDPTRRLGRARWSPAAETRLASGPDGRVGHPPDRRPGRGGHRRRAARADRPHDHHGRRLRQGAPSVRQAHRQLPGGQAPAGRRPGQARVRPPGGLRARPGHWTRASPTARRAASTAKAYASDAATEAARVALQVHGAIGYTWECDLHLFLKRAWALAEAWGSAADHRHAVLASLVAGVTPGRLAAPTPLTRIADRARYRRASPPTGHGPANRPSPESGNGEGVDGHPVVRRRTATAGRAR